MKLPKRVDHQQKMAKGLIQDCIVQLPHLAMMVGVSASTINNAVNGRGKGKQLSPREREVLVQVLDYLALLDHLRRYCLVRSY